MVRGELDSKMVEVSDLRRKLAAWVENPELHLNFFFRSVLYGNYDITRYGLRPVVGHIIYRLSDFIDPEERKKMNVYPVFDPGIESGTLVTENGLAYSLEDWRREWALMYPNIPSFTPQLPAGFMQALRKNNP